MMMNSKTHIKLYADGACWGNPGPSAAGMAIFDGLDNEIYKGAVYLGKGTNNTAEYSAVIEGLKVARDLRILEIDVYSDSELIIKQLRNEYRVKSENLIKYKNEAMELIKDFKRVSFKHLKREYTDQPHKLAESLLKKKHRV